MSDFHTYRRDLPHWRLAGSAYFVTWRVAPGSPQLTGPERDRIARSLRHFEGERYDLLAFVVMDDHVHVLLSLSAGHSLESVVHSWKSFTAHALVHAGRTAPVWQREYHDRIVRDDKELTEKASYILGNPRKRWPEIDEYAWVWALGC